MAYRSTAEHDAQSAEETRKARVAAAMEEILSMAKAGQLPAEIAHHLVTADPSAPCHQWSMANRLIMRAAKTADARGYRQWQDVGRHVRKGAKAFHILAPRTITITETDPETGEEVKRPKLIGFLTVPVFRVEDTEGEPLPAYNPPPPPPLADVAKVWGIRLEYGPTSDGEYGYYSRTGGEVIHLSSQDPDTYWHEIGHAAHARLLAREGKTLVPGQQVDQEVVAELVAATIGRIEGRPVGETAWALRYMQGYSGSRERLVGDLMRLADTAEACVRLILDTAAQAAAA